MKLLLSLDRALAKLETVLLVVFLGAMVVFAFAQVILRNVFGTGLIWGDTLVRHMVLWTGFVGGALAAHEGRHISIDALTKFLSPRIRMASGIATHLFAAVVCCFLTAASWAFLKGEMESSGDFILGLPEWVAMAIIPFGYALITVHFTLKVIGQTAAFLQPKADRGR